MFVTDLLDVGLGGDRRKSELLVGSPQRKYTLFVNLNSSFGYSAELEDCISGTFAFAETHLTV